MATYDYKCTKCKTEFEEVLTFAEYDKKKIKCPKCKSTSPRRVYKKPATIQFKGAGFYINDKDKK